MTTTDYITAIGILLVYSTTLIGFWINIKIKINGLEIKLKNLNLEFMEHKNWGLDAYEKQIAKRNELLSGLCDKNDIQHEKINDKIEILTELIHKLDIKITTVLSEQKQ